MSASTIELLFTAFLAMAPISELRGAIPYGLAHDIPPLGLYFLCVAANVVPVPFIVCFTRTVLLWMKKRGGRLQKAADWLSDRAVKKSALYQKYEQLGLFILVAIPLPGTGAWTGALVAALMGLRIRQALPAITAGVAAAGAVVMLVCTGVIHLAGI